jgi:hypothetical protein
MLPKTPPQGLLDTTYDNQLNYLLQRAKHQQSEKQIPEKIEIL